MSSLTQISINDKNINSNIPIDSKEKEKHKNKLNTKIIFINNKIENRTKSINIKLNPQKLNFNKTINDNPKQIFKKINLKIASRLITNDLLKIKPNTKIQVDDTIKSIKSNLKNKENTFIPNKNFITITEPSTNINKNSRNKIRKNFAKKSNPFILINQPIEPITIEMEKFKKMRMIEHKNSLENKLNRKSKIRSNNIISKTRTSHTNFDSLIQKEIFDEKLNKTTKNKFNKDENIIYKSYRENLFNNKKRSNKSSINEINSTTSYLNSLEIKKDFHINNNTLELLNSNNNFNLISLRDSALSTSKEKDSNKKALTAKTNFCYDSISNNCFKKKIETKKGDKHNNLKMNKHSSFTKKNKKKIDKKKTKQNFNNLNMIDSYQKIPHKKQAFKINNQRNPDKTNKMKYPNKEQNKGSININKEISSEKNLRVVIKNKIEILLKILKDYKQKNFEFFLNRVKKMVIIKNIQKSKESEKTEMMNIKLKKKEKDEKIKNFFVLFNKHYNDKILLLKKLIFNKLKHFANNNKKLESLKRLINFCSKYNESIKSEVYYKIKKFFQAKNRLDAIKRIYNSLFKSIFYRKYMSFYKFRLYYNKRKQKKFLNIIYKILLKIIIKRKRRIFNIMILYFNNHKKEKNVKMNKTKDLMIKIQKYNKRKIINRIKSIVNYKNKLKSAEDLIKLFSKRILFVKKICFKKITKFILGKRKEEGIDRLNNILIEMELSKLRIYFMEFINNIIKLKIRTAYEKINKIFLLKKSKIKSEIFFKLKKDYKKRINIRNLLLIIEAIYSRFIKEIKKYSFEYIKNNFKENKIIIEDKKNTERRWENNKIDTNIPIQIDSKNKEQSMKSNILKEESMSFTLSKAVKENKLYNNNENDEDSDNEIWTTCIEKWGIIYNIDDSLYQKINED